MIVKKGFITWDDDRLTDKAFSNCRVDKACVNSELCDEIEQLTKMLIKKSDEESVFHSGFAQLSDKISTSLFDLNDSIRSKQWYTARSLSRVIFENIAYLYYCLMDDGDNFWERIKPYDKDSNDIGGFRSFVEKRLGWTIQYIQLYVSNNNAVHSNYDIQYGLIPMKFGIRHGYYDTIASRVLEDVLYRCVLKFNNFNDADFSKEIKSFRSKFDGNLVLIQPFEEINSNANNN